MASLIMQVLKDKNNARSSIRQQQRDAINDLKKESVYALRLRDQFNKDIDPLLDSGDVESVSIVIPENWLGVFLKVIYREEFADYSIIQRNTREFEVSRKEIYL